MFTAAKDALASHAARNYANGLIKRYGEVKELKIDSLKKSVEVICLLTGENEPVKVIIENYRIESEGTRRFVEVTALTCSRPWLHNLLEDHARGRRLELPSWAAAAL